MFSCCYAQLFKNSVKPLFYRTLGPRPPCIGGDSIRACAASSYGIVYHRREAVCGGQHIDMSGFAGLSLPSSMVRGGL